MFHKTYFPFGGRGLSPLTNALTENEAGLSLLCMNTLTKIGLVVLPTLVGSLALTVYAEPAPSQVSVSLRSPVSLERLLARLGNDSSDTIIVQSSFSVDGRTIQDFSSINPGDKAGEVSARWANARQALIVQLQKDHFFDDDKISADATTPTVQGFILNGNAKPLSDVITAFPNAQVTERKVRETRETGRTEPPLAAQPLDDQTVSVAAVANAPYYTLVPVSGTIRTGLFTAPGVSGTWRGVQNYMRWNSNGFASDQTYEHDFFLLNNSSSPGTYFARSFSSPALGCRPNVVYAATSWPQAAYPFLDSDLESNGQCSSTGYISYTIMAAQANAITTGVNHFTAILMPSGDAATDIFLLQGQVGYRNPVTERGPLTNFPYGYRVRETTHYNLIASGAVPGNRSWTFNGKIPEAPINLSVTNPSQSSLRVNFTDITWDETKIVLERSVGGAGTWTVFNFGILNAGTMVGNWYWGNTGLASKTKYCYRMKASNALGSSPYSATACGTT